MKISDCHIWLGVARSKKRGRVRLRRLGEGGAEASPAWRSRCRTVSALAGRKNNRRSHCEMRLTPKVGFCCLIWTICSVIAAGSLFRPRGREG